MYCAKVFILLSLKNNFVGSINCSPEPEFIEEIVEVIWKRLKGESSTVQSHRQIDNPSAGEDSSIIISQNDASSVQNAIAEWSRIFFLGVNALFVPTFWGHFCFGPYISILPLLVPNSINACYFSPFRHSTNRKS